MTQEEINEKVSKMSEIELYFAIDECGAFIWSMNHNMAHGRIPESDCASVSEDIINVRKLQQFAVENLVRFGIDISTIEDRENGEYWKWLRFYDNWKKNLPEDVWNNINDRLTKDEPINEFLPKESWRD